MPYVAALDQGTTSTRCMIVDGAGRVVALERREHVQHRPGPGLVEHDAVEILEASRAVVRAALRAAGLAPRELAALGITNQRETVVAWDRATGRPVHRALVWQDLRTAGIVAELAADGGPDRFRERTGLPLATYFSGPKLRWLLDEVPGARALAEQGRLLAGTIDAWLAWNLTGGPDGGLHVTDVTNASRTQLMGLASLSWEAELLAAHRVPAGVLPRIVASSGVIGACRGELDGVPLAGIVGDQQAALFGQAGFEEGATKCTYGTGCFLLRQTGGRIVPSTHGLLTTVAARIGDAPATYALEGSVAVAGSLVGWLRDNLGLIAGIEELEPLAASVPDSGGVVIVPAFSGLFAPHWRSDARGIIGGLTGHATRAHLARAALDATAWQTRELIDAIAADAGDAAPELRVDGGMTANALLLQLQADVLGIPVVRPAVTETTALGAAFAAGLAVGAWGSLDELRATWRPDRTWRPALDAAGREHGLAAWRRAVERSLGWAGPA